MIFKHTVRGGLVLAALAGGCSDHHLRADARAMLDAGAFDTGTMLDARDRGRPDVGRDASDPDASLPDAGRLDSSTPDSGDRTMLEAAIRAVCTKINECVPAEVPDVEACVDETLGYLSTYPPACTDAIIAYGDCIYMPECSVILDAVMFDAHVEANCTDERAAVETECPEG